MNCYLLLSLNREEKKGRRGEYMRKKLLVKHSRRSSLGCCEVSLYDGKWQTMNRIKMLCISLLFAILWMFFFRKDTINKKKKKFFFNYSLIFFTTFKKKRRLWRRDCRHSNNNTQQNSSVRDSSVVEDEIIRGCTTQRLELPLSWQIN